MSTRVGSLTRLFRKFPVDFCKTSKFCISDISIPLVKSSVNSLRFALHCRGPELGYESTEGEQAADDEGDTKSLNSTLEEDKGYTKNFIQNPSLVRRRTTRERRHTRRGRCGTGGGSPCGRSART